MVLQGAWRSYSAQPKNEFGDYEIELYFGPQKNAKNPKICAIKPSLRDFYIINTKLLLLILTLTPTLTGGIL